MGLHSPRFGQSNGYKDMVEHVAAIGREEEGGGDATLSPLLASAWHTTQERQCCNCGPVHKRLMFTAAASKIWGMTFRCSKVVSSCHCRAMSKARPREPRSSPQAPEIPFRGLHPMPAGRTQLPYVCKTSLSSFGSAVPQFKSSCRSSSLCALSQDWNRPAQIRLKSEASLSESCLRPRTKICMRDWEVEGPSPG